MAIEIWVRLRWDESRGTAGFLPHRCRVRGQRLAPGYDGWFAGVPVRINSLGFRDRREYRARRSRQARFGSSCSAIRSRSATARSTTPPIRTCSSSGCAAWRPDVNWEVWNLGVPGYNTATGAGLSRSEIGPRASARPRGRRFLPERFHRLRRRTQSPASLVARRAPRAAIRCNATCIRTSSTSASS